MAATRLRIFVTSVQKEFAEVRANFKTFLLGDAVLRPFISEVFLFEELPASKERHRACEVGMIWSFEPRSGAIYVAQCVSIGIMDRVFKSRGAAVSRRERINGRSEVRESAPSLIATLPGCRRSAADRYAIRYPNAHALGYVDDAAPRLSSRRGQVDRYADSMKPKTLKQVEALGAHPVAMLT